MNHRGNPTGRVPRLTPEQAKRLRAWAAFGTSTGEVGRRLGVTPQTVRRYIRDEIKTHWTMKESQA